ncbi:MAG: DUF167 domain-containing protein [Bryobacteraceae bacterium]|jgi:uncharacterized protein (TIGR00251 family)
MLVSVRVKPNSKNPRIERAEDGSLTAYLKSPPIEGKANQELIARLAESFGVPKSRLRIKSGLASRTKLVEIDQ